MGVGVCNSPCVLGQPRKQWSNSSAGASDKENEFDACPSKRGADEPAAVPSGETPDVGRAACPPPPTPSTAEERAGPATVLEEPDADAAMHDPVLLDLPPASAADGGPVLQVAQFAACPWVDFGHTLLGKRAVCAFTIKNPSRAAQNLCARACALRWS